VTVDEVIARHRKACAGFSAIVRQAEGNWGRRSPCAGWDSRGVVEHVIGFHDVLLLRPTGTKPSRPKDDPLARWAVTVPAIDAAIERISAQGPAAGTGSSPVDLARLLPVLTTDVLAHTWDLARAVGVDDRLDPGLCEISYRVVRSNDERLRASGMFDPAVPVAEDADPPTRLIAFLGRDPEWSPPTDQAAR
jgi:uncharacterized protein (TIGR03086 family)